RRPRPPSDRTPPGGGSALHGAGRSPRPARCACGHYVGRGTTPATGSHRGRGAALIAAVAHRLGSDPGQVGPHGGRTADRAGHRQVTAEALDPVTQAREPVPLGRLGTAGTVVAD